MFSGMPEEVIVGRSSSLVVPKPVRRLVGSREGQRVLVSVKDGRIIVNATLNPFLSSPPIRPRDSKGYFPQDEHIACNSGELRAYLEPRRG